MGMSLRYSSVLREQLTNRKARDMGQRLVSKRQTFKTRDGALLKFLIGASPDDDQTGDDGSSRDDKTGDGSDTGSEGQDDGKDGSKEEPVTQADLAQVKARMQAADKRASEAEKKVKEYEDKGKDVATKATERVTELETENTGFKAEISTLRVQNAFLSTNSVTWHDPDVALQQADLSEVTDADGNINKAALKKALEALAKAKPFLVKPESGNDDGGKGKGKSGGDVGSGHKNDGKTASNDALRKKYPALSR